MVKQGLSEPKAALKAAVIQVQQVAEFPKLCLPLEGLMDSDLAFDRRYKAATLKM